MSQAIQCVTCGEVTMGEYCSRCGERAVTHHDYSLAHFLELTMESLFHLDGRLFNTFRLLLEKPGALAENFIQGKRKPYMGPVQCFLVSNLVYFLILPFTTLDTFTTPLALHLIKPWHSIASRMVSARLAATGITQELFAERFDHTIHLQAHTLLIIMIPMFALALWVLYGRATKFFAKHLVFSFYVYSFVLLWIGVFALLERVTIQLMVLASIPIPTITSIVGSLGDTVAAVPFAVYLLLASRRFYRESFWWVLPKTIVLTVLAGVLIDVYRFILFFTAFYAT